MIVDKLEQTDGFKGLYGEVVTEDCYGLKKLPFAPDIIFDIGANIGIFARYARSLFPDALIISVEPDPDNSANFSTFTNPDENIILIRAAIGQGDMWKCLGAPNGAHECFLSAGLGFEKELMQKQEGTSLEKYTGDKIMLDTLIFSFLNPGVKSVIKIDIEGGENAIFSHKPSMDALKQIDYIAMEVHFYALHGKVIDEVSEQTIAALATLEETHDCKLDHVYFTAVKK